MSVLLVTGSSRGIGAAIARRASLAGYALCVNYRVAREQGHALVEELRAGGGQAIAVQADVTREEDVETLFSTIDRTLGPVTHLVNNAGIMGPESRVDALRVADLQAVFQLNVFSAFLCSGQAVKRMSTARGGAGGAIVNVSSVLARLGASGSYVHYAASKGALNVLTRGLALEVAGEGIRVNAVQAGLTATEMVSQERIDSIGPTIPWGRVGRPEEIAEAVFWLLSDAASYVTGSIVDVGGGR